MKVLIACEYSGRVRDAFLHLGHDAMSCDLLDTDSDNAGLHYQGDIRDVLYDGWDLMICHPPCTFLTGAAEWAYSDQPMINGKPRNIKPGTLIGQARIMARQQALEFIDLLWRAPIDKIALENPVGVIGKSRPYMPKPQYVQPHWFGEDASKKTGLWLKNLPGLVPTDKVEGRKICCGENMTGFMICGKCLGKNKPVVRYTNQTDSGQNKLPPTADRWKLRSTTPQGLADAMASQWGTES